MYVVIFYRQLRDEEMDYSTGTEIVQTITGPFTSEENAKRWINLQLEKYNYEVKPLIKPERENHDHQA